MYLTRQAFCGRIVDAGAGLRAGRPGHRDLSEMVHQVVAVARDVVGSASRVGFVYLLQVAHGVGRLLLPFSRRIGDGGGITFDIARR